MRYKKIQLKSLRIHINGLNIFRKKPLKIFKNLEYFPIFKEVLLRQKLILIMINLLNGNLIN